MQCLQKLTLNFFLNKRIVALGVKHRVKRVIGVCPLQVVDVLLKLICLWFFGTHIDFWLLSLCHFECLLFVDMLGSFELGFFFDF